MHFWDGFYNRNVSFVIIMDMRGLRITTNASDLPWGRVPVFLIVCGCGDITSLEWFLPAVLLGFLIK